ncbi:hypothetical protein N7528_008710 [Penicillium herquei]|nr:hypothetical protein N7528_008710 [Penicillium herquei]
MSLNPSLNGTNFTNPVVDLQFDSMTANMTIKGYFFGVVQSEIGSDLESWYGNVFAGTFVLSFLGVIDSYHSDILKNDTATPTWIPTVGYNNNSLNVGYTNATTSGGSRQTSSYGLAMLLLSSLQALAFFS